MPNMPTRDWVRLPNGQYVPPEVARNMLNTGVAGASPAPAGNPAQMPPSFDQDAYLAGIGERYAGNILPNLQTMSAGNQTPFPPNPAMMAREAEANQQSPVYPTSPAMMADDAPTAPAAAPVKDEPMGLLDRLKAGFSGIDQSDALMALGSGMLGLSNDPNLQKMGMAGFGQVAENKKTRQATAKTNQTVEALRKMGRTDLADAVESGMMPAAEAAKILFTEGKPLSTIGKLADDLKSGRITQAQYDAETSRLAKSGQTVINMPQEAGDKKYWEEIRGGEAKYITELANSNPDFRKAYSDIQIMRQLGETMSENSVVPDFLKQYTPQGIDSSIDAYRSMLNGVALSLRPAGSGPMTDNDFRVLQSVAGSESLSVEQRRVIQSGLEAAAKINLDLSRAAADFRANPSEEALQEFRRKAAEIKNRPLFTDEQRTLLGGQAQQAQQVYEYDADGNPL